MNKLLFHQNLPKSLDDISHNKHTIQLLKNLIKHKYNIPNIICTCSKGTGKKTVSKAFLYECFGETIYNIKNKKYNDYSYNISDYHIEINVELFKSSNDIYKIIKEYSKTINIFTNTYTIIMLYNCHKINKKLIINIKKIIQKSYYMCRLWFIGYYKPDSFRFINGSCITLPFSIPKITEIHHIISKHDITIPDNIINNIISRSHFNITDILLYSQL